MTAVASPARAKALGGTPLLDREGRSKRVALKRMEIRAAFEANRGRAQQIACLYIRKVGSYYASDIQQAALEGLLQAILRGDMSDPGWAAYSAIRIRGTIVDEMRRLGWLTKHRYRQFQRGEFHFSLIGIEFAHALADQGPTPDHALLSEERARVVHEAFSRLSSRDQLIVRRYFSGETLQSLADEFRLEKSWVSRICSRGLERMRKHIVANLGDA